MNIQCVCNGTVLFNDITLIFAYFPLLLPWMPPRMCEMTSCMERDIIISSLNFIIETNNNCPHREYITVKGILTCRILERKRKISEKLQTDKCQIKY